VTNDGDEFRLFARQFFGPFLLLRQDLLRVFSFGNHIGRDKNAFLTLVIHQATGHQNPMPTALAIGNFRLEIVYTPDLTQDADQFLPARDIFIHALDRFAADGQSVAGPGRRVRKQNDARANIGQNKRCWQRI